MPNWSNQLPEQGHHMGFDLRRTPASATLHAIATCDDILVCDTHYFHGRTLPCERQVDQNGKTVDDTTCGPCTEKQGYRTHVYISAYDAKRLEHFIFECTAQAAKPLKEYVEANGTLRGCIIYASRPKAKANSKVAIQTAPCNQAKITLPQPPDLRRALTIIWRIPQTATVVEPRRRGAPRLRTNPAPLSQMRQQANNETDAPTIGEILRSNGHKRKEPVA